ncbi:MULTISPECIES: 2OG-Fe(II) oxygenase [Dyella]|uniref:2OG-Fe(II) oxygenase n=2 Tax=Dyella TaxID=231454 RepID=A0A4R0Z048_9GAMM|nr:MULTISPECIES: 2OG-Fe(II) oxygenase [Dyella]TBR39293.1 2OG-Fe(II) oxygenase [Dyella terrae]TCI13119.1 2OG-Fe(II) oxygenase [Dyella soli]
MNAAAAVLLDPARLDRPDTDVRHDPFPFMIAHGQLPDEFRSELERDFPRYASAGFFPYDASDCGPTINALVQRLTTPEFASAIGTRLGIDNLGGYPTLVTLCRSLNRRHGTIHTDSRSKVATALLYLNTQWPDTSDGCLRFLGSIDNIDDIVAPELKPLYGEFAVFKRCDNSFHGHLPYEGERRVIQVAWLTSEEEKLRKTKRGKFARAFKKIFGALDRRLGAGRDRNAAHRD